MFRAVTFPSWPKIESPCRKRDSRRRITSCNQESAANYILSYSPLPYLGQHRATAIVRQNRHAAKASCLRGLRVPEPLRDILSKEMSAVFGIHTPLIFAYNRSRSSSRDAPNCQGNEAGARECIGLFPLIEVIPRRAISFADKLAHALQLIFRARACISLGHFPRMQHGGDLGITSAFRIVKLHDD